MANYYGRCKKLIELANTNISQGAFDFINEVGFTSMMGYINEGAEKVLNRQMKIWFDRCPDIYDEFQTEYTEIWADIYEDRIGKEATVGMLLHDQFQFFDDILDGRYYLVELSCPLLLRTLIKRIREDDVGYSYAHSFIDNCENYFDEIKRYVDYLGM